MSDIIQFVYLGSAVAILLGLQRAGSDRSVSMSMMRVLVALAVAIIFTLFSPGVHNQSQILIAMIIGLAIAVFANASPYLPRTSVLPLYLSCGAGAAAIIGFAELSINNLEHDKTIVALTIFISVIASISFSGLLTIVGRRLKPSCTACDRLPAQAGVLFSVLSFASLSLLLLEINHFNLFVTIISAILLGVSLVVKASDIAMDRQVHTLSALSGAAIVLLGLLLSNSILLITGALSSIVSYLISKNNATQTPECD